MKLDYSERKHLPSESFAIPESRKYPIHDQNHAKNALARASGTSDEARVRAAVHRRYPSIGKAHAISEGMK